MKQKIPNIISFIRIPAAITLLLVPSLSFWFYAAYLLCGFSDVLDGFLARKLNAVSRQGAQLDSIADFIFWTCVFWTVYPHVEWQRGQILWICLIALVKCSGIAVGYVRFHRFALLHTWANKLTGLLLYVFPLILLWPYKDIAVTVICAVANFAAVEELILLTGKAFDPDVCSIFGESKSK